MPDHPNRPEENVNSRSQTRSDHPNRPEEKGNSRSQTMPDHPNRPKEIGHSRSTPTVARHSRHSARHLRTSIGSTLVKFSPHSMLPTIGQSKNKAAEARLRSALSRATKRDLRQLEVDFRASLVRAAAAHDALAASNNREQERQGPAVARGQSARSGTTVLRRRGGAAQSGLRYYENLECEMSEGAQRQGGDKEGDA